jgi:hypothetical protein
MSWRIDCTCNKFYSNMGIIHSGLHFLNAQEGIKATLEPFVYCPYCGKTLKTIDNDTGKEIVDERQLKLL